MSGCRVIAVQYRLTPEHTYPVALITALRVRDAGLWLSGQLIFIGVKCTAQRYPGVIHAFFQPGGISQTAHNLMWDIGALVDKKNDY
ncbi:alpha/beta hydrolase fold domain-containing protein [Salmonella enterica]|nr:alpha/beta hydrolase fold domain-containing protein [Salmonella enterica]